MAIRVIHCLFRIATNLINFPLFLCISIKKVYGDNVEALAWTESDKSSDPIPYFAGPYPMRRL